MFISVSSYIFSFIILNYLLYKFTKGKLQKVLSVLFNLSFILMGISEFVEYMFGLPSFDTYMTLYLCIIFGGGGLYLLRKTALASKESPNTASPSSAEAHPLAVLKGEHVCGLSVNEGVKVSVQVYTDKIVFLRGEKIIAQFITDDIIYAHSHSEEVITDTTITASQNWGLSSVIALFKGDWAKAYRLRPGTTSYEASHEIKVDWYLILDTTSTDIAVSVRSKDDLFHFAKCCNDMLFSLSSDDDDELEADIGDTSENNISLNDIDQMNGPAFEQYCAKLLEANGYTNVRVIGKAGDHGMDILAEKDGAKWGFQCKRWNQPVGNREARDIVASNFYYKCNNLAIITTSTFTRSAKEYAESARVFLWDRAKLNELIYTMNHQK